MATMLLCVVDVVVYGIIYHSLIIMATALITSQQLFYVSDSQFNIHKNVIFYNNI